ncbi:MAG: aldo/keto reductase [Candidatus Izemoplasmataceae bacterium]
MKMRRIHIGNKEEQVSLLGFGCMRFPEKDGEVDFDLTKKMMDYAMERGVNYIDTAYPYHGGKSEVIVRELLIDKPRSSYFLADKLPLWDCKTKEDVVRIFHEQLEKTGVEYFDFYLIHAVNKERYDQTIELGVLEILEQFRDEGKLKNIGFSFHDDLETFKKWVDLYEWDFVQIQLNYMDIEHQQGIEGYQILTEKGIPVIVMEPVKGGSLAKFNQKVEQKLIDREPNKSIASWAFRYVGSLPNVKVILSGMSNFEQVKDNIETFTHFDSLNEDESKLIMEVREDLLKLEEVPCTSCNYCMPCPHGVNIPGNFRIFNAYSMYQDEDRANRSFAHLVKEDADASMCIECGECLPKCPQKIEIPSELERMNEYFEKHGLR